MARRCRWLSAMPMAPSGATAITTARSTRPGCSIAHSSVCMPPIDPPSTSRSRFSDAQRIQQPAPARAHYREWKSQRKIRTVYRARFWIDRPRPRRSIARAQQIHANHAVVVKGLSSPSAAKISGHHAPTCAEPESAWHTSTALSRVPRSAGHTSHSAEAWGQLTSPSILPALQQQVLVEHKVAFVRGLNHRPRRRRSLHSVSIAAGRYSSFSHSAHCAASSWLAGAPAAVCPLAASIA